MKIASLFAEGCQKGQKAINADHLYICFLIISWISSDRQTDEQINRVQVEKTASKAHPSLTDAKETSEEFSRVE